MARKRRKLIVRDRKKTAFRIALTAIILLTLIGIGVLTFFIVKSCGIKMTVRAVPLNTSDMICGTGDGIMYVRGSTLSFLSYKDEDRNFTRSTTGSAVPSGLAGTPEIKVVYSENAIQIVGGDFNMSFDGSIEAVRCGSVYVAVCSRLPNGDEQITVYTSAGQQLKVFDFIGGGLIDFGFSEASGSTLWTMELDTDSGSPRTTISTFDLSRMSSTGVITVSGQLVEDIFFTNSSVFVIGTESLIRYSAAANREVYRVQLYGYRVADISLSGDSPMLMLVPRSVSSLDEATSVRVLTVSQKDVADETAITMTLPQGTVGCHLTNGYLAVIRTNSIELYSGKGKLAETETLAAGSTSSSRKLDEKHILLERSGEFVLLTIGK
jgi:hypothetical protein